MNRIAFLSYSLTALVGNLMTKSCVLKLNLK